MKKIIALLLTFILTACCLTVSAGAFGFDDLQPNIDKPAETNLIVLDNYSGTFDEDIFICCRSGKSAYGEESTIRVRMDRFLLNDYADWVYRFSMPAGMQYFYFTDGKIRTTEMRYDGSVHLYPDGSRDENGYYSLWIEYWAGGVDPAFCVGASRTVFDRFNEEFNSVGDPLTDIWSLYDELYFHCGSGGEVDWVLLKVESFMGADAIYTDIIGNRLVENGCLYGPFESGYGLYDVAQDRFVTVSGGMVGDYDGLAKAFDEVGSGRLIGDIDGDDSITVLDATIMQRCDAKLAVYPEGDEVNQSWITYDFIRYYSDFNRDGERGILDATCIQRYLAGMSYPVG